MSFLGMCEPSHDVEIRFGREREFLVDAALKNALEFEDGIVVLGPFGAGLDVLKGRSQDLHEVVRLTAIHLIALEKCFMDAGAVRARLVTAVTPRSNSGKVRRDRRGPVILLSCIAPI